MFSKPKWRSHDKVKDPMKLLGMPALSWRQTGLVVSVVDHSKDPWPTTGYYLTVHWMNGLTSKDYLDNFNAIRFLI